MEKVINMHEFTFYRQSNDFDDILKDRVFKKYIKTKLRWTDHLLIQLELESNHNILGYIVLKYGDDIVKELCKDFSPIPYVEYTPIRTK